MYDFAKISNILKLISTDLIISHCGGGAWPSHLHTIRIIFKTPDFMNLAPSIPNYESSVFPGYWVGIFFFVLLTFIIFL